MKCFNLFTIKIKFILLLLLVEFTFQQWPKVENVKKSQFLPSLEVKIHPPDQFQPKVQAAIAKLEETREKNEKKWMQELEEAYNKELQDAGKEIVKVVKDALAVFEDPNLLKKSVEFAINPPLIVMVNSNNMQPVNKDTSGSNTAVNQPSFKEIANIKMNDLQRNTMKILIEEDNQVEKMRGAKMSIITDEDKGSDHSTLNHGAKFKQTPNKNLHNKEKPTSTSSIQNGPINFSQFGITNSINNPMQLFSFMEMEAMTTGAGGKYTKPIAVLMKLPSDPDPKLKKEIETIESKREGFEAKLFKKAKEEFKLITALTKKELQINLNHELLPFFVVSKNGLQGVNDIITNTFPSQTPSKSASFLQIDKNELHNRFPHLSYKDDVALNKHVYSKILNFFADSPVPEDHQNDLLSNKSKKLKTEKRIAQTKSNNLNQPSRKNLRNNLNNKSVQNEIPDLLSKSVDFNYEKCLELTKHLKHLDCNAQRDNYKNLNQHLYSSFLQLQGGGGDDLINVKFAASDEPYPTIEKLVAQMMTRRDLVEKYERLKILEYESHLQKAENEMIQDILHENLFKIMAIYGPSIEGMKEHIH